MYNYFVAFGCLGQKSRIPELQLKKLYFCAPFEKMEKPLITLLWGRFIFVEAFHETPLQIQILDQTIVR